MKKFTLPEANAFLNELMKDPEGDPAILICGKKPIAVIFPVGDADLETVGVSFSPVFQAIMTRSRRRELHEPNISHEEICRQYGLPLPADRAANGSPQPTAPKRRKSGTRARTARAKG